MQIKTNLTTYIFLINLYGNLYGCTFYDLRGPFQKKKVT